MDELTKKVDDWWVKSGRDAFLTRVKATLEDSKVRHILTTEKDKGKLEERLAERVDADLLPFILA